MAAAKPQNQFVKQAGIIALSMFIGRVLGFIYRLPLTGLIGDEGNAWYTAGYNVYMVVLIIVAGALPAAVSKLVSERIAQGQYRNAHGMFQATLSFAMMMGLAAAVGMWFGARGIANLMGAPQIFYPIRALAPAMLVLGPMGAFRGYFLGMKTAFPVAVSQISEQIFNVGFSLILAFLFFDAERLHRSVAGAAAGTSIGALVGLGVIIGLYALVQKDYHKRMVKDLRPPFETERTQIKLLLTTVMPIILGMVFLNFTSVLDIGMANARLASSGAFTVREINELAGQFGMKFLVLTALPVALVAAFSLAVIPEISASNSLRDSRSIRANMNTALRLAMVFSTPAAVGLAVLADPILALLFPSFPEGGILLRVGAVSIIFMAINQVLTATLQGIGKAMMPVIAAAFGLLVKIPINYFLMALSGINVLGAVISTIVCFIVASVMNLFFLYKTTKIMPRFGEALIKPLIASAVMGLGCFGLHRGLDAILPGRVATVIVLCLGFTIYIATIIMMRGLSSEDVQALPLPKGMKRWMLR